MVGFIGAGNMARALALGWASRRSSPTASRRGRGRSRRRSAARRSPATRSSRARADLLVLAHKPAQLRRSRRDRRARLAVASLLGGVTVAALRAAYPGARSGDAEHGRRGPRARRDSCVCGASPRSRRGRGAPRPRRHGRAARRAADGRRDRRSAASPAYVALIAEAWVDAAVGRDPGGAGGRARRRRSPAPRRCCSRPHWTRSRSAAR